MVGRWKFPLERCLIWSLLREHSFIFWGGGRYSFRFVSLKRSVQKKEFWWHNNITKLSEEVVLIYITWYSEYLLVILPPVSSCFISKNVPSRQGRTFLGYQQKLVKQLGSSPVHPTWIYSLKLENIPYKNPHLKKKVHDWKCSKSEFFVGKLGHGIFFEEKLLQLAIY